MELIWLRYMVIDKKYSPKRNKLQQLSNADYWKIHTWQPINYDSNRSIKIGRVLKLAKTEIYTPTPPPKNYKNTLMHFFFLHKLVSALFSFWTPFLQYLNYLWTIQHEILVINLRRKWVTSLNVVHAFCLFFLRTKGRERKVFVDIFEQFNSASLSQLSLLKPKKACNRRAKDSAR